jgi:hypothetical protein
MPDLEEVLMEVWRQTLVDGAEFVEIDGEEYPVRETARRRLKQVDLRFDGHEPRGLEQNLDTNHDGRKRHAKERRLCSFLTAVGTLLL